jgi:hypothetical protein
MQALQRASCSVTASLEESWAGLRICGMPAAVSTYADATRVFSAGKSLLASIVDACIWSWWAIASLK